MDRACVERDGLLRDVLEGRMLGSRPQGRPWMEMIVELWEVDMKAGKKKKESFGRMKRRAEDRQIWIVFVPRICREAEN